MATKTLASLDGQREIRTRILALSETDTRRWGKMSILQMMCHLADSYEIALGVRVASPASGFAQRTIIKWFALQAPLAWPKGVPTRPEVEAGKSASTPLPFPENRDRLLSVFDDFCTGLPVPCIDHPIFGPMTLSDWQRWGYLHADHHLRQFSR